MILTNLIQGKFIRRYKRFFIDVELDNGDIITAHTNDTGSMASLLDFANTVWIEKKR